MAGPQKKTQKGCLKKVEKLGSQKDFPFIVLINPKPCKKGEKKAGCKLAGSQQPQQKGRVRHGIYQPLLGSKLKPESNQRNPLGHPERRCIEPPVIDRNIFIFACRLYHIQQKNAFSIMRKHSYK